MSNAQPIPDLVTRHVFRTQMALDCPHCGEVIERYAAGTRSTIGQPTGHCPACSGRFRTLKTEWGMKSRAQKVGYFLKQTWANVYFTYLGSLLLLLVGLLLEDALDLEVIDSVVGIAAFTAAAVLLVRAHRTLRDIRASHKRTFA